jgi:hypothetical protein
MRASTNGKKLIAFTRLSDYRKDLRKFGIDLPSDLRAAPTTGRASGAGAWLRLCTGWYQDGDCTTISSGEGVADFRSRNGCDWFGYCWNFVNTISSVEASGQNGLLFDSPDFNRGGWPGYYNGNIFTVLSGQKYVLLYWGFDNITESAFMFW